MALAFHSQHSSQHCPSEAFAHIASALPSGGFPKEQPPPMSASTTASSGTSATSDTADPSSPPSMLPCSFQEALLSFGVPVREEAELFLDTELVDMLGEGRYGRVWEVLYTASGSRLACKELDKLTTPQGTVLTELASLARVKGHPNVLSVEQVYEGAASVYIVTEKCNSGDLFDHIRKQGFLPETEARELFAQVAAAVGHCHANGVMHRDIKPENILLDSCPSTGRMTAKLADFGLAALTSEGEKLVGRVGSKPYEAPEMVAGEAYNLSADVFSLGVLLYAMLSGTWPQFDSDKCFIPGKSFAYPAWQRMSVEAKDLITRMLSRDPELRPQASQILLHPWLNVNSPRLLRVEECQRRACEAVLASIPAASCPSSHLVNLMHCDGSGDSCSREETAAEMMSLGSGSSTSSTNSTSSTSSMHSVQSSASHATEGGEVLKEGRVELSR